MVGRVFKYAWFATIDLILGLLKWIKSKSVIFRTAVDEYFEREWLRLGIISVPDTDSLLYSSSQPFGCQDEKENADPDRRHLKSI